MLPVGSGSERRLKMDDFFDDFDGDFDEDEFMDSDSFEDSFDSDFESDEQLEDEDPIEHESLNDDNDDDDNDKFDIEDSFILGGAMGLAYEAGLNEREQRCLLEKHGKEKTTGKKRDEPQ
jgi:hypothetical protein